MKTNRLEAFSDGVIAIIITIMVLELKVPHDASFAALSPLVPKLLCYLLSFIYLGIYWNNHHHMFQACDRVSGGVLWANLHLLLWLSLIPFTTAWAGENHFEPVPTALYGVVLLCSAIAYQILVRALLRVEGPSSVLARAVGTDFKGWLSTAFYAAAIPLSLYRAWLGGCIYVLVALVWLLPDRRIERVLGNERTSADGASAAGSPHDVPPAGRADSSRINRDANRAEAEV